MNWFPATASSIHLIGIRFDFQAAIGGAEATAGDVLTINGVYRGFHFWEGCKFN